MRLIGMGSAYVPGGNDTAVASGPYVNNIATSDPVRHARTKAVLEANDALEPKLTEAEVKATLPLLAARNPGQPYGYMDPRQWGTFAGWMRDNGLIESLPEAGELLSNDYLSGEIPE